MSDQSFLANLFAWSVQVALVTGVAAAVLAVLRVNVPSIRYHWWRAVLAFCLVLPLIQPWRVPDGGEVGLEAAAAVQEPLTAIEIPAPPGPGERLAAPGLPALGDTWPAAITLLLIAGAALRFAWLGAGILRLRRLRGAGERAEPSAGHAEVQKLTDAGAEIRYVKVLGQPVTFGLRRPIVLLPDSLRSLPEPVQRAVLAHELWHVQRRDWAWLLVEECIRTVLWFHPAIWFLVSRVQASREEVVDELTVLLTNSRRTYLEALLAFADKPPLFAAAPFAKRRHLFQRMLLISKEAVMSSRRIIASSAAMAATVFLAGWTGAAAFPLVSPAAAGADAVAARAQQPPRDHRPGDPRPATSREQELQAFIAREPNGPTSKAAYLEIAKLQEARAATADAEATLQAARAAFPSDASLLTALARFYTRTGQFDSAVGMMEEVAAQDPSNPQAHHVVATYYQEKVQKDQSLMPIERLMYIRKGIEATDRALALDPDYTDAMIYKNILLRRQANVEPDPSARAALIAEADALRNRAIELRKARGASGAGGAAAAGMPPPPPPPPPPAPALVNGQSPVRIGGEIKPPTKIHDVRPVYPPIAESSRVQGVVIIEVTLDEAGSVYHARVLRSIPLLDEAALDAVRQWKFVPTLLNGAPVPVIMTVTVNFTLQ